MNENKKISYYNDENDTLSLRVYNVGQEQCPSLHQWGPGIRNYYLLHHIVSGKGIYKKAGKVYEISAGNTFIIYPGTEITYIADKDEPWNYYWVGFTGNDARVILNQTVFKEDNPVIYQDPENQFEELLMKIYMSKGNLDSDKLKMSGYLLLALSYFVDKSTAQKTRTDISSVYMKKAMEYIEFNYTGKLNVQEIADYIGISRSRLYRVFVEIYDKSPMDVILEYRIQIACQLLKHSNLSISAVGYSVGFEDNLYFSRAFKKMKGISPREYIKKVRE